jgi:uncharacterized protein YndB with AHSA1/START domain
MNSTSDSSNPLHGTLATVDGRPALRFQRRLSHGVERVWRAISEPEELSRWFLAVPRWTLEAGAAFEVDGDLGGSGKITELEPPRLLAYDWDDERFRFELHPAGDGCLLIFTHVFDDRVLGTQHAPGWEAYLERLDAHLEGRQLPEAEAYAMTAGLLEGYAERFGIDPQVARRMFGQEEVTLEPGPLLRLERHYGHPVERVWRALTDPDELEAWFPSDGPLEVTESKPPRLLEGTWFGDRLRFELHPEGEGSRLVFTHAFTDRDTAARTAAGWDRCFAGFDALLLGLPLSEKGSLQLWPRVHEHYAERFGVDPEIGRKAYAEHPMT